MTPPTAPPDHARRRRLITGQLAAGIAHDFNNLLATLLGSLELMERRLDRLPPEEQDRFARLIHRSTEAVQKAGGMTARLLSFARRQPQQIQPVQLTALIPELLELAHGALGRRVQTTTSFPESLRPILADRARLELALLALILAIRDDMPEGGNLSITVTDTPTHLELAISHSASLPDEAPTELAELLAELNAVLTVEATRASLRLPRS